MHEIMFFKVKFIFNFSFFGTSIVAKQSEKFISHLFCLDTLIVLKSLSESRWQT